MISQPVVTNSKAQEASPSGFTSVYLPIVTRGYPMRNIFGISMTNISEAQGLSQVARAGTTWTRLGLLWSTVEPVEGARNWSAAFEQQLLAAVKNKMRVVVLIESTPNWALKPGYTCGAVNSAKFAALASFLTDAVKRYSQPPYNVHLWEMWNEPDVAGFLGCWGDPADTQYYGGYHYGTMLSAVSPSIKANDLQAKVLVGGLLLNCDPRLQAPGKCVEARFLNGILASGAGPAFDGVAFHGYDYYVSPGRYSNQNWGSTSETTGPVLIAKAAYLRSVLQAYNYPNKFLISTENALFYGPYQENPICVPTAPAELEWSKAYYLIHSYTAAIAEGLQANMWYAAIGLRCSSLFDQNTLAPLPAFRAYEFLRLQLQGMGFAKKINQYPGVMGYEFKSSGRTKWVIWSSDGAEHVVPLSAMPTSVQVVGMDGNPVSEVAAQLVTINISPRVIEFAP